MKLLNKILAFFLYNISLLMLGIYIIIELNSNLHGFILIKITSIFMFVFLSYLATYFMNKIIENKTKLINLIINIYFIIYIVILVYLTVFSRHIFYFDEINIDIYIYYIQNKLNLIPFKSILELISYYIDKTISLSLLIFNIVGNIVALTPLAFFLPYKYKSMNKFKNFFITMIIIVCIIELTQFITLKGICDIDDLILNVGGSCIIYKILKIPSISKIIAKITFKNI